MSDDANKELSVKDVCEIIHAGASNGLATLKWAGLELTFKEAHTPGQVLPPQAIEENSQGPEKDIPEISPEALQKMEQDVKQAQLEQMLITDPAQFEEMISTGDIEDDKQAEN